MLVKLGDVSHFHKGEIWSVSGTTAKIPVSKKVIKDSVDQHVILSDILSDIIEQPGHPRLWAIPYYR